MASAQPIFITSGPSSPGTYPTQPSAVPTSPYQMAQPQVQYVPKYYTAQEYAAQQQQKQPPPAAADDDDSEDSDSIDEAEEERRTRFKRMIIISLVITAVFFLGTFLIIPLLPDILGDVDGGEQTDTSTTQQTTTQQNTTQTSKSLQNRRYYGNYGYGYGSRGRYYNGRRYGRRYYRDRTYDGPITFNIGSTILLSLAIVIRVILSLVATGIDIWFYKSNDKDKIRNLCCWAAFHGGMLVFMLLHIVYMAIFASLGYDELQKGNPFAITLCVIDFIIFIPTCYITIYVPWDIRMKLHYNN